MRAVQKPVVLSATIINSPIIGSWAWKQPAVISGCVIQMKSGIFRTPAAGDFNIKTSFKTHYLVTIGPRIGYSFGKWLPYVTGGLAIGDLDLFQRIRGLTFFFDEGGKQIETNVGWMVGGITLQASAALAISPVIAKPS